ncbi:hypothetical protein ACQ4PT_070789 [Festuca glaucescens]
MEKNYPCKKRKIDNNYGSWDFPAEALVEILVRLPPNARRTLRLVCRHWRELIDHHTATDMRSRTLVIAVADNGFTSVVDLLTPRKGRGLWRTDLRTAIRYSLMSIVGTCNGLVCLCDDDLRPGGAITVGNPFTGEALPLPPLPMPGADVQLNNNIGRSWHQTYSFAYHHGLRRYKVVHVPCHSDQFWQPDIVHVFTLGETSWRDVHTAGTDVRCSLGSNQLADVDGTVYWLTGDAGKIMSFDLKHERLTRTEPLEVLATPSTYRLAKVHGMLGVAVSDGDSMTMWVLEGERWSRRYVLEGHALRLQPGKWTMRRELAGPHLVHGDYFLTLTRESPCDEILILYGHTLSEAAGSKEGVVQMRREDEGEDFTAMDYAPETCADLSFSGVAVGAERFRVHDLEPMRCVAFKGMNTGRRFHMCCVQDKWVDAEEWPEALKNSLGRMWSMYHEASDKRIEERLENAKLVQELVEDRDKFKKNYYSLMDDVAKFMKDQEKRVMEENLKKMNDEISENSKLGLCNMYAGSRRILN